MVLAVVVLIVFAWLYEALMTSAADMAPRIGKQAVGVRIVCADGAPLSFGRATGRYFLKVFVTPMIPSPSAT